MADPVRTLHHDIYPVIDPAGALSGAAKGLQVLVTGASRGIGRGIALAFARAGATKLILLGRDEQALAETAQLIKAASSSCKTLSHALDLTRPDVLEPLGRILEVSKLRLCLRHALCTDAHQAPSQAFAPVWLVSRLEPGLSAA